MKKAACFIITVILLISCSSYAFAKPNHGKGHDKHQDKHKKEQQYQEEKQEFKIDGCPVIKCGNFKLPIPPVEIGMDAEVTFDKSTSVLQVVKGSIKIIIDFKNESVSVNGVIDYNSGIFTSTNKRKTTVLIKYIAGVLGIRLCFDDDDISVEIPKLNRPTNVTVTPVGPNVLPNTLNTSTLFLTASADITAGQAAGGRAELYVGSRLIAADTVITAADTQVTFTTSDGTPDNAELQALIPSGGNVKVVLYNSDSSYNSSSSDNLKLIVDYKSPTITGINSADYHTGSSKIYINVTGAGAVGDMVDVTKISLYDYVLGKTYWLTSAAGTGSNGSVIGANSLVIRIGTADMIGLAGFNYATTHLTVAAGSLLKDEAGNTSPAFTSSQTVPMNAGSEYDSLANITVTPFGINVLPNTLNSTTLYMTASANITAGLATGGRAELYVGSRLAAVDTSIAAADTSVTFTTSDGTPDNAELQAYIPEGGTVSVKLYNAYGTLIKTASAGQPLIVDYFAPVISGVTSALYNAAVSQLYILVSGAGAVGDKVDVTRLSLYDTTLGKYCQLTNYANTGSNGYVSSSNTLVINIGSADKKTLADFGKTSVYLNIPAGSLLSDTAGNTSPAFLTSQSVPVTVVK